jgi:hypothetical protein
MSIARSLKVGDTAYILAASGSQQVFTGVVKRITATGQVTVERKGAGATYDTRFSAEDEEIGASSRWHRDILITKERYDYILALRRVVERTRTAQGAMQKLANEAWGTKPDVPALLKRLDEIRALVRAID